MPVTEREDLARTRDAHVAALNAGDADGWVSCFTPDGVQMPPNEPANEGTDRIRAWSAGMLAAFNTDFRLEVDEEERLGDDWALERGIYWIALTQETGGKPIRDHGKYITLYRRDADGEWRIARDIWNSDGPPA
jgi:uncharacterized protein (TIGR02246 family)